jgi:tRNA threonylcarbamoyladenosine biosynthesis protein TsaB
MLLLATDTSGKFGSIGLAHGNPDGTCRIVEVISLDGGAFSAQLVPEIAAVLAKHAFSKAQIGAFCVASGPGSFTGLRVGLAAVKALAEVLQKPIAAVSLLEAVAERASHPGRIMAAMDAGRNEVYAGVYEAHDGNAISIREELISLQALAQAGLRVVTPDRNIVDALAASGVPGELVERPQSDSIARIGWRKIRAGDTVSPEVLEANYIRRSDAEIFSRG